MIGGLLAVFSIQIGENLVEIVFLDDWNVYFSEPWIFVQLLRKDDKSLYRGEMSRFSYEFDQWECNVSRLLQENQFFSASNGPNCVCDRSITFENFHNSMCDISRASSQTQWWIRPQSLLILRISAPYCPCICIRLAQFLLTWKYSELWQEFTLLTPQSGTPRMGPILQV